MPSPIAPIRRPQLTFREASRPPGADVPKPEDVEKEKFRGSLSAVEFADGGATLFLGGDETVGAVPSLERLARVGGPHDPAAYGGTAAPAHESLDVERFIELPDNTFSKGRKSEIDIEGLAIDGGHLWMLGSHSTNRREAKAKNPIERLGHVEHGANRVFLGRIPLVTTDGVTTLAKADGTRSAARLSANQKNGDLLGALRGDPHLGPFLQPVFADRDGNPSALPGKDNGFDFEGLAVAGERIFLGMRGPVLRGWAVILEVMLEAGDKAGELRLRAMPDERLYRKHFVKLHGLGLRDLAFQGGALFLLAGPTMALDGPVRIYRWSTPPAASESADTIADLKDAPQVELPFGDGVDHAEGLALIPNGSAASTEALIVYDSPAPERFRDLGPTSILADVFPLPQALPS